MKSITQIDAEQDTKSLISAFIKLIGLAKTSKKVNFKQHSLIDLITVISWLIKARFDRKSMGRCDQPTHFTARTGRNVLNDGRINWQKLVALSAAKLIKFLRPAIDKRRRLAFIVDDTLISRSCSKKTELLAKVYDHDQHKFLTGYCRLE